MKKNTILLFLTVSFVFLFGFKIIKDNKINSQTEKLNYFTVTQKISTKEVSKTYDRIKVTDRVNALQLLQKTVKVITKGEGPNAFIISIENRVADTKQNEYWSFEVNGKESPVGAGSYILKPNDTIIWTIKKF